MKYLKIHLPSGANVVIHETEFVKMEKLKNANERVVGKMIDGELHIVPDVPPKDTE